MYKRRIVAGLAILALGAGAVAGCKKETPQKTEAPQSEPKAAAPAAPLEQPKTGEALFKQHCAVCHPDGGNIVNPKKTLHQKALAANNISRPEDIVKIMRSPGQGMNTFDEATIPEKDALAIAQYVLDTFR